MDKIARVFEIDKEIYNQYIKLINIEIGENKQKYEYNNCLSNIRILISYEERLLNNLDIEIVKQYYKKYFKSKDYLDVDIYRILYKYLEDDKFKLDEIVKLRLRKTLYFLIMNRKILTEEINTIELDKYIKFLAYTNLDLEYINLIQGNIKTDDLYKKEFINLKYKLLYTSRINERIYFSNEQPRYDSLLYQNEREQLRESNLIKYIREWFQLSDTYIDVEQEKIFVKKY